MISLEEKSCLLWGMLLIICDFIKALSAQTKIHQPIFGLKKYFNYLFYKTTKPSLGRCEKLTVSFHSGLERDFWNLWPAICCIIQSLKRTHVKPHKQKPNVEIVFIQVRKILKYHQNFRFFKGKLILANFRLQITEQVSMH